MIKLKDMDDELIIINNIHIEFFEKKYSGIKSTEFNCTTLYKGIKYDIKLFYFNEAYMPINLPL